MAITTFDGYIGAAKQVVPLSKTATRTSVTGGWFSMIDVAGNPGAGVIAGSDAVAGVVPQAIAAGYPTLNPFSPSATGYITNVDYSNTVACRLQVFDNVYKVGSFSFAAGTSVLSGQPSYASRMPNGDFGGTQIWVEVSTAFATGTAWQVQVTYTNQAGVTGRSCIALPAATAANLTLGRMYQLGLLAGDSGVRTIESVVVTNGGTAMTAGAFNILVMRPLWTGRVRSANDGDVHSLDRIGMPVVFEQSALTLAIAADNTSTGFPELMIEVCNG